MAQEPWAHFWRTSGSLLDLAEELRLGLVDVALQAALGGAAQPDEVACESHACFVAGSADHALHAGIELQAGFVVDEQADALNGLAGRKRRRTAAGSNRPR